MTNGQSSDDEEPPDLSSLASQTAAISLISPSSAADIPRQADISCCASKAAVCAKPAKPLKRGFLDAGPTKKGQGGKASLQVLCPPSASKPSVPSDFIIPPDEYQLKLQQRKTALLEKIKPTQDTLQEVFANPELLSGFDDPEVMRAVNDIAADPNNMRKYKNKPKVLEFYRHMSGLVASKLEGAEAAE